EEGRDGEGDDDETARHRVETRAVADRLADAERDRDRVGKQRRPQAERDRHRHLLEDEVDDADRAEIALAEVEGQVVAEHDEETLMRGLVEAELALELLDESGRQTLGAAVLAAATPAAGVAGAGDPVERPGLALDPGDHLLDRTARHELDEDEV